jgi:histidinol-phosphate aminotransferase
MKVIDRVPEYIRTLVPYAPGKPIEEVEREYGIRDSVKLASNENPLGPSPKALEALQQKIHQLNRYPDGHSFYLRERLAAKLGVGPENLIFGNGSNEIIELAVRTFMQPGDEAVMADQAFVVYRLIVQAAGGVGKAVPLKNFAHDLAAIGEALSSRTRLVFLSNPNNPTGTIFGKREWEAFLDRITPEMLVLVDEAYFEYVTNPDYPDSIRYRRDDRCLLTLRTFSKLYGLAGLRVGYGVGPKDVVAMMQRVRQPFNINAAAQWAALAALEDQEHVDRTLAVNRAGMAFLTRELERLGLGFVPSDANFILVRVGNGRKVFELLLRRGVIVRTMDEYRFPEHVRVTVGKPEENSKFIEAMEGVIKGA